MSDYNEHVKAIQERQRIAEEKAAQILKLGAEVDAFATRSMIGLTEFTTPDQPFLTPDPNAGNVAIDPTTMLPTEPATPNA